MVLLLFFNKGSTVYKQIKILIMNRISGLLCVILCYSCTFSNETEKYQGKRDKIVNVRDRVKEIKMEEPLISSLNRMYIMDNYLIIQDMKSYKDIIHLFDKNDFTYVTGLAEKGQGPNEIANMGLIALDEAQHKFYVSDHGKQRVLSYDVDSVLSHASYQPEVKMKMDETIFPDHYQIINDSVAICRVIQLLEPGNFNPTVGKMDMKTGEITPMKYENPHITGRKRSSMVASIENGLYLEYYHNHDLMTICNLDGDLICNVYGPDWSDDSDRGGDYYYSNAIFCGNKIFATYLGEKFMVNGRGQLPTLFLVFDLYGNYIQTLDTGCYIIDFCYDTANNRIILSMNDEKQFAYLPLDGLI
jgi:hypothetical protein